MKVSRNLKKVTEAFPELDIVQCECFMIGAKVLVTERFLSDFYGVSGRAIRLWREKGLPLDAITVKHLNLYNLSVVINWNLKNIKQKSKSSFIDEDINTELHKNIKEVTKEEADRRLQIQKVLIEQLKHDELVGKLVRADDLDKTLAEQAVMHKVSYMEDLETLPTLLQDMSKSSISNFLQDHYANRMENALTLMTKVFKEEDTLHSIIKKACLNGS